MFFITFFLTKYKIYIVFNFRQTFPDQTRNLYYVPISVGLIYKVSIFIILIVQRNAYSSVILSVVEESSLMPKAIRINKKSDRNRNAMKISRLVGLNSKAELLLLRSYFLVSLFLFHLSLPLKNMAVICNSALLFLFCSLFFILLFNNASIRRRRVVRFSF